MSDAIPYKQIIDRVKSDIDWIAEQAHAKGYNEAKFIYQNPNAESDYQRGLDDAWEAARKITNMQHKDRIECFGFVRVYSDLTASEVLAKLKAYEEQHKSGEIKVSDIITEGKINYLVIDITDKSYVALQGTDFEPVYIGKDYIKSYHNLHDSKDMRKIAEEINKAMKGEPRDCHTCKHQLVNSIECVDCCGYEKWEPKEGAE